MKRKILLGEFISLTSAFFLPSCNYNNPGQPEPVIMYMDIVQFAKPEYINYVVVDRAAPEYDENSCKIRMAGRACQELYLGSSPYIALPDNYYIIDWKWGSFIYPPTNFLINCQWTDVKDRLQIW